MAVPCVAAPNGLPTAGYGISRRKRRPSPNAALNRCPTHLGRLVRASCEWMKMEHGRWGGGKGVSMWGEAVLNFKNNKKTHLEDSAAVPFSGQGLVAKAGKVMKRRVCRGKRCDVPDFHCFSRRFYAAFVSEASWCLEIGLTLGSIQLRSCQCSIPDAQLRKELQIIWKRHMATSKAWAAEKSCIPFHPSYISLPFLLLLLLLLYIGRFGSGSGIPLCYSGYFFWQIMYPGWTAGTDRWQVWVCIHLHAWTLPHDTQDNNKIITDISVQLDRVAFWRSGYSKWVFQWDSLVSSLQVLTLKPPGVLDSNGVGVVLVALAAPGLCWYEKSRPLAALEGHKRFPVCCRSHTHTHTWAVLVCGKDLQQERVEFLIFTIHIRSLKTLLGCVSFYHFFCKLKLS